MITHDPKKTLEDLRDHLARHDRPLAFLFGAGASSSVNIAPPAVAGKRRGYEPLIPAIAPLTKKCESVIKNAGNAFSQAWDLVWSECPPANGHPNIEDVLSKIRTKIDAVGPNDKLVGLARNDLESFEERIRTTIANEAAPDSAKIPDYLPHDDFARWIKEATRNSAIEIFTTNYDVLIERALERARIPVFDGFVGSNEPFFISDCLERKELLPSQGWVRLWKIHGSVNWTLKKDGTGHRVIRTQPAKTGEMILPSHRKYDESRKQLYLAILNRLSKVLDAEDALLITSGFSFGDEHINAVIFTVLENRPRSHVICLHFSDLAKDDTLVKHALLRKNFLLLGPNGAVIRRTWADWRLAEPVDEGTAQFIDVAFDTKAEPENGNSNLEGVLRLGDFNVFCRFLRTMTPKETT